MEYLPYLLLAEAHFCLENYHTADLEIPVWYGILTARSTNITIFGA
jgi:hypothetical protein